MDLNQLFEKLPLKIGGLFGNIALLPRFYIPYLFYNGKAKPPFSVMLEITYRCNLRCEMCPFYGSHTKNRSNLLQRNLSKELKTNEILRIIDNLSKFGVKKIYFSGGEPFLRHDFFDIIEYAKLKNFFVIVLSNGTLINREVARKIVELRVDSIEFSLDGPKAIHDKIRGKSGAFKLLMNAVDYIQEGKRIKKKETPLILFNCIISKTNEKFIGDIFDIAVDKNVDTLRFDRFVYCTQQMMNATSNILPALLDDANNNFLVSEEIRNINVDIVSDELSNINKRKSDLRVISNIENKKDVKGLFYNESYSYLNKCFYPWRNGRINPYGDVYPCPMLNVLIGNVKDKKYSELWNNGTYINFRRKLKQTKLFPSCTKCYFLNPGNKLWDYLPKLL